MNTDISSSKKKKTKQNKTKQNKKRKLPVCFPLKTYTSQNEQTNNKKTKKKKKNKKQKQKTDRGLGKWLNQLLCKHETLNSVLSQV